MVTLRRDVAPESRFRTGRDRRALRASCAPTWSTTSRSCGSLNEHERARRLPPRPPRRSSAPPTARRSPPSRRTSAAPTRCSRPAAPRAWWATRSSAIVVASSDKAYGDHDELPYHEDFPLQPRYPYDVSKAATDMIARTYAAHLRHAGRGHAAGQRLRRRRLQPLARRARHDRARCCAASGRSSARTARPSATTSTWRTRWTPTWRSRSRSTTASCAGGRGTPATGSPCSVLELVDAPDRGLGARRRARHPGRGHAARRDRPAVPRLDRDPRRSSAGSRAGTWTAAWPRPTPGTSGT